MPNQSTEPASKKDNTGAGIKHPSGISGEIQYSPDAALLPPPLVTPTVSAAVPDAPKVMYDLRTRFRGYHLVKTEPIKEGAKGKIYLAKDDQNTQEWAIKEFKVVRFDSGDAREEVRKLQFFGTYVTGFVQIKDAEMSHSPPYYVMPYFADGNLEDYIVKKKPSATEKVELFKKIVTPMAAIHQIGQVHGDIKPTNILMNGSKEPIIADVGLAKLGRSGEISAGTLFYMPPEQSKAFEGTNSYDGSDKSNKNTSFDKQEAPPKGDTRWDVYALGATLYWMLTGKRPRSKSHSDRDSTFLQNGEAYRETLRDTELIDVRRLVPSVDRQLSKLIADCLELDPEKRPKDAGEILKRIKLRYQKNNEWPYKLWLGVATAVILTGSIFAAIGYGNWLLSQSQVQIETTTRNLLRNRAFLGSELLRDKIETRQRAIEQLAQKAKQDEGLKNAMMSIKREYNERPPDGELHPEPFSKTNITHFDVVNEWVERQYKQEIKSRTSADETLRVSMQITVKGMAYVVAITDDTGKCLKPIEPINIHLFRTNWSWRDYYSGTGNHYNDQKSPRAQISSTHVSQAYISKSDGQPKVDISTPFLIEDGNDSVRGIFIIGIDVRKDLTDWLTTKNDTGQARSFEELVLVNDRGYCVFHPGVDLDSQVDADMKDIYPKRQKSKWDTKGSQDLDKYTDEGASDSLYFNDKPTDPAAAEPDAGKISKKRWAFAQPLDSEGKGITRNWFLIAQVPEDVAMKLHRDLRDELLFLGRCALLSVVSMLGLAWLLLWSILRSQREQAHEREEAHV